MNAKRPLRLSAAALAAVLILAGCPANVPQTGGDWYNLGEAGNGNLMLALDKNSIRRNGPLVTFRDRKIVVDMKNERFVNVPPYKTAISTWEMHCTNKTFRLVSSTLYDDKGKIVSDETYTAVDIRPMAIPPNSLTGEQHKIVCAG
ncbi:Uncharacterised protein [Kingella potus]|uniref:Surface-adhesin protein E-like domain-containing protein n=1 Tax=Kingella potus TaxID=265175 RepID=A0A377R327_9NEIS|nr:surface-adhesin E family protein [Kingella potus]UOP00241.1 hypothetical protein LVJ84_09945 [Kingella potus]STR02703.1 Uncharacterised protein [Kingella potus]